MAGNGTIRQILRGILYQFRMDSHWAMRLRRARGEYRGLRALWGDQRGVTAIEYGLIAALIMLAIVAAMHAVGTGMTQMFNTVSTTL